MKIYIDTVVLIYLLEHTGPLQVRAASRLSTAATAGDQIVVSELVRLECRVMPIRLRAVAALATFDAYFAQPHLVRAPITPAVFDRATVIRADQKYALGDSLHLAAAVEAGCDLFLSNDHRLASFPDITVEVLP